jgi:undecaprenyl-diphosphatase
MSLLEALMLGLVQGVTEFLPVSSTAHLRVVPALLGMSDPGAAFSAIIQLGTTAAVILYFGRDIWRIVQASFLALARGRPFETFEARMGWYLVVATVPVVVAGLALRRFIESSFRSLQVIAWAAIGMAILLALAEWLARHARDMADASLKDAAAVGAAQALALIPGTSRSGITLTAGLFLGLKREAAARFSFLLSIPATLAAGVFELRHLFDATRAGESLAPGPLLVGTAASLIFGLAAIAGLLRFLQTRTTLVFIVYRVAFGAAILILVSRGALTP